MGGHNLTPDMSGMATIQGKSMFGGQPISGRRSAPAFGFGSGTRQHQGKLYIGPEAAKTASVSISPGACYETPDSVGRQADGGKNSQPEWRFGTQERFAGRTRSRTPGPGCAAATRPRAPLAPRQPLHGIPSLLESAHICPEPAVHPL